MSSNFPAGFDSIAADKSNSTVALNDHSSHHNDLADAVNAIQTSLGVNLANVIGLPQQSQSANYTLTLADAGKSVVHPITDNNARTFTIPPNFSVAYPVGTQITFVNMANTLTVELANDLMYLAAFSTYAPASVQIAAYGVATALKITNTSWIISGQNVTADASLSYNFLAASSLPSSITFTRASTATFFNSSGTLTTAAIDAPRFDYNPSTLAAQGLLIEEQRTNSIRNNTMQGAVAGTPGTLPTNWPSIGTGHGVTQEIIGVGTENGVNYIDIRFFTATTAAANNVALSAESSLQIAAANGQSWASSWFVKVIAAPLPFSSYTNRIRLNDSGGAGVGLIDTVFTPTSTLTRYTSAGTIAVATTAFVQPQIRFGMTIGQAYDVTIRIGLPQLELGAFATSVIPTTTTALTRSADVASVNTLSPWYNSTQGTLYAEAQISAGVGSSPAAFASLDDTTTANRIQVRRAAPGNLASFRMVSSAGGIDVTLASGTLTGVNKTAAAFTASDQNAVNNGTLFTGIISITSLPTVTRLLLGDGAGSLPLNGYLRRITYYPRRLSNAELQAITA